MSRGESAESPSPTARLCCVKLNKNITHFIGMRFELMPEEYVETNKT